MSDIIYVQIYKHYTGLSNQLYLLFVNLLKAILNSEINTIYIGGFLLNINSNHTCPIDNIIDMQDLQLQIKQLYKRNIQILPYQPDKFILLKAEYGIISNFVDVTDKMTPFYVNNSTTFMAINKKVDLNMLFGEDPAPNQKKQLKLTIQKNNYIEHIYLNESLGFIQKYTEINYTKQQPEFTNWTMLFDIQNIPHLHFFINKFTFSNNIINEAQNFIQTLQLKPQELVNVLHLRTEDDAINHWSKINKIDSERFKKTIFINYQNIITNHFHKNIKIVILTYDSDNPVIQFLKNNQYQFFIRNLKGQYREYQAAIDMQIGFICNNVFIGSESSTFSQIISKKINNLKTILLNYECIDTPPIIITKQY